MFQGAHLQDAQCEAHLQDAQCEDCGHADAVQKVSADAAGKWLRNVCMKPRSRGFEIISEFLNKLDSDIATAAVVQGNATGKAPIHFVSQIRGDNYDGLEMVQVLLQHGADVNAKTRRGQTPLIFAAGRGHNQMVRLLLRRGANPRVIAVTGSTAVRAGRSHLDRETFDLLEAAEASFDATWIDYRNLADAIQVHADVNAVGTRQELAQQEAQKEIELRDCMSADLFKNLPNIFLKCDADAVYDLVEILAARSKTKLERSVLDLVFQKAISDALTCGRATLLDILPLFDEEALGRACHAIGHRDRRLIHLIFRSLFQTLQQSPCLLQDVTVAELLNVVSPHLAIEVLRFKPNFDGEADRHAVENLWQKLVSWSQLSSEDIPEVSIFKHCLGKKQGGAAATELLHRLWWACDMEVVTPMWTTMVEEIIKEATRKRHAGHLLEVIKNSEEIPSWVLQRLGSAADVNSVVFDKIADAGFIRNTSDIDGNADLGVSQQDLLAQPPDLPKYVLKCAYEWVPDDTSLSNVWLNLSIKFKSLEPCEKLLVGVDTEWGVLCDIPSVVQLAVRDYTWVIDTARTSRHAKDFFTWLFQQDNALFLGFAFSADAQKLEALMQDDVLSTVKQRVEVIDIQKVAIGTLANVKRGQNPGLKAVAEGWLGVHLDKTEQCSDWDRRPLTEAQIHYAAADAAVMLDIAAAMSLDSCKQIPESMITTSQPRTDKMHMLK